MKVLLWMGHVRTWDNIVLLLATWNFPGDPWGAEQWVQETRTTARARGTGVGRGHDLAQNKNSTVQKGISNSCSKAQDAIKDVNKTRATGAEGLTSQLELIKVQQRLRWLKPRRCLTATCRVRRHCNRFAFTFPGISHLVPMWVEIRAIVQI